MAIVNLTEPFVRTLAPDPAKRIEVSDEQRPGLRLRVSPKGRKTWVYEKRVKGGKKRKHDLGSYPEVSIKTARKEALEIQLEAERGIDRVERREQERARQEAEKLTQVPVRAVLSTYYELHASNLRTGDAVMASLWAALDKHLDMPIQKITQQVLQQAIDAKARSGAPVQANRLKAHLAHFAKFARARFYLQPGVGTELQKAVKETARERELSLDDVRRIYNASYGLGDLWGPLVRLLILTGQRKEEIAALRWSEVNLSHRYLNIGGSRTKNGSGHITHLSRPAFEELEWLRAAADDDEDLIFTTTGNSHVSGFAKMKAKLDKIIGADIDHWRLHDLRTAFATIMAEADADEAVVDRILNHVAAGSAPSVTARVYNRAKKLPQRRIVLERWGSMVTGKDAAQTVVRIA